MVEVTYFTEVAQVVDAYRRGQILEFTAIGALISLGRTARQAKEILTWARSSTG